MMIPEQRPAASQNSMRSPREWQPSQESATNLTFLHVPLVKESSQKFTSVQTCRGLSCSRDDGREGRWGRGEPLHRGIRLCKQMSWLPFSSRAVRGHIWSSGVFFRDKHRHWTNLPGSYSDCTILRSSFRPVPSLAFANHQLKVHLDNKINRLKNYNRLFSSFIWQLKWIKHTFISYFKKLHVCYLYCRELLLWRSHHTETREYQTQFMLTFTSATARGRGANTSALLTFPPTVNILWIFTPFICLWHWRSCILYCTHHQEYFSSSWPTSVIVYSNCQKAHFKNCKPAILLEVLVNAPGPVWARFMSEGSKRGDLSVL